LEIKLSHKDDLELSRKGICQLINQLKIKIHTEQNNALLYILNDIDREIVKLIKSIDQLDYASLHTRNIFELYLILRHVYSDRNALWCWYGQQHKDSTEVRNGFKKLLQKRNLDTSALDEVQAFDDMSLEESHYKSEKYFNIRKLAKDHGYEDDYLFVYKLSSMLVHPSSLKVNGFAELTENNNYLTVILQIAVYFCQKAEKYSAKIREEIA